ncbi:MAG: hypothetical protein J5I91_06075 [Bacteroidetes bacterium]|nr:hypothetical protein [Bacteroidota bacterium]
MTILTVKTDQQEIEKPPTKSIERHCRTPPMLNTYNGDFENIDDISLQPNISNSGFLLIEVTTSNGVFRNKLILNNN